MKKPTESELEILRVLWQHGINTVKFVHEILNANRPESEKVGYTTTLKTMQIMSEKQILKRDTSKKTHLYEANLKQEDVQQNLIDRMLHTAFGGSAKKLVMQALGNRKTNQKEREEIRRLLDELEQNEKGGSDE